MDRIGLALITIAAIGPALVSCSGTAAHLRADDRPARADRAPADGLAARVEGVVARHNAIRAKAKLNRLEVDPRLTRAAQWQADDMAGRQKMGHRGSDGSSPFKRMERAGYPFRRAGENVAYGYPTDELLMKGWMDSPPHKKNIRGSFTQIGAACAIGEDGRSYWCVTFGVPMDDGFPPSGPPASYP